MFIIIYPASLLYFIPYTCLIVLWSLHWVAFCSILFVPTNCFLCMSPMCGGCLNHNHGTNSNVSVVYIFCWISLPLWFLLFSHIYGCLPLLFPFTLMFCVAVDTLRLHSSAYSDQMWSSYCLNCLYRFLFVVVSLMNAASRAFVSDVKFMIVSSILPCFTLLDLSYPANLAVFSSSSLYWYASWINAFSHAMWICVFLCCKDFGDLHICQLPIRKWRITRYCKFLNCLQLVRQGLYWLFDIIYCIHFVLIPQQVSGRYLDAPNV